MRLFKSKSPSDYFLFIERDGSSRLSKFKSSSKSPKVAGILIS